VLQRQTRAALLQWLLLAVVVVSPAQTSKSSPLLAHQHGLSQQVQSWFMCWLLAVALVAVLVAVEQLHRWLLLHLAVVAAAGGEEQNCGFLLRHLALLKQSLWVLVVLAALLEQQMIAAAQLVLVATIHCSVLGRLLEVVTAVVVEQQLPERVEQAVGAWEKLFQAHQHTLPQAVLELQQLEAVVTVEDIDQGEVLGLVVLEQVQPLQIVVAMVERAALFLHLQPHPLQVVAVLVLLKLTAATALTQQPILLVAMAVVVEAPA
jgi:hypothetical protein